jgi:hypothetical protein
MYCSKFSRDCPHKIKKDNNFIFVIMPFDGFKNIYDCIEHAIKGIEKKDFISERSDSKYNTGDIWDTRICQNIRKAKYCIVDTSTKNANVFYELGFAHAIGNTKTIIITQDIREAPFDIQSLNHIIYSKDDLPLLRINLQKAIKDLEETYQDENMDSDEKVMELEKKLNEKTNELNDYRSKAMLLKEFLEERQKEIDFLKQKLFQEQKETSNFRRLIN